MVTIRLAEALDKMNEVFTNGDRKPFSIRFLTYDEKRQKGGHWKEFKNMVRCGQTHNTKKLSTIGIKPMDGNSHPIAVHIRLIQKFNGMEVIL